MSVSDPLVGPCGLFYLLGWKNPRLSESGETPMGKGKTPYWGKPLHLNTWEGKSPDPICRGGAYQYKPIVPWPRGQNALKTEVGGPQTYSCIAAKP